MSTETKNTALETTEVLWALGDLYPAPESAAFQTDIQSCRERAQKISTDMTGRVHELSAVEICQVVEELEEIDTLLGRLGTYAFLNFITQTADAPASALLQQIEELESQIGKQTLFFRLEWNTLDAEQAQSLLQQPALVKYHHFLASMRRFAPHQLSAKEEELLQDLKPVGRSAWNLLFEKVLGQLRFGELERSEEEVLSDLYNPDRTVRVQAAEELTAGLRSQQHILTHIFNTLAAEKMIDDRLRSYPAWDSAMHLSNELSPETVDSLVDEVTARYDIVHRYYQVKKGLLGVDSLYDYDRYAPVPGGQEADIPWSECKEIVLEAFAGFSPEMANIAQDFFEKNWIHAPLLGGKRGGAFAHPCVPEVHPYVMVNYTGNIRDVSTVAHELGHGVHQVLAARQGYYNSDTPLVLAETASVFAELLVFKAQVARITDTQARRAFVCQKLESIFATVFRQVSMNRFEHALHTARRGQGELSAEQISALWMETQRPMFGETVTLREDYSIWWTYISHFLATPGYVYSYAFGELLVLVLYARYLEKGESFVVKYMQLLGAGGNGSPAELVQPFGIDLSDAAFWRGGLSIIESMLAEIE
ncbi:M3 family oligoendopeptidase [Desulfobulbus rhabdoformis]|uniref:M3 family oligoendopeptidase n=1 Tax=Desulfobulbus rhabdoformis TaxID=34032 RepID=UPI001963483E|nr:M3 family oligoendopeptidase [Desulfobulbus rhabdoformis]MBM9612667.1 M3 family oligoendopeptidase [Desulfobulbus rhabdoformis]